MPREIRSCEYMHLMLIQGPKLKIEYRNETQYRKPGFMNGVRQFVDTNIFV